MPGHRFVDRDLHQPKPVVLAKFRFNSLPGPIAGDRSHPVEGAELRFERGGWIESRYSVRSAHELRRGNYLQIAPRWKGHQMLLADKFGRNLQAFTSLVHEMFRRRVLLSNRIERFADRMRRCQLGHLLTRFFQSGFGLGQDLLGSFSEAEAALKE